MDRYYAFFSHAFGYKTIESGRIYNFDTHKSNGYINTFDIGLAKFFDEYMIWHQSGTARLCTLMAARMGLSSSTRRKLIQAALVHDIGKLFVSSDILTKDGEFNYEEMALMKNHSAVGAEYLIDSGFPKDIITIVRHHHERFDGMGYPDGLRGNSIPIESRIIAICDTLDAMLSGRHYKPKLTLDQVMDELEKGAGKQFDPYLTDIATKIISTDKEKHLCSRLD